MQISRSAVHATEADRFEEKHQFAEVFRLGCVASDMERLEHLSSHQLCHDHLSIFESYFPLKAAARFSRNAVVPSVLSSVAQATPKRTASRYKPSCNVISIPLFTASMAY